MILLLMPVVIAINIIGFVVFVIIKITFQVNTPMLLS